MVNILLDTFSLTLDPYSVEKERGQSSCDFVSPLGATQRLKVSRDSPWKH